MKNIQVRPNTTVWVAKDPKALTLRSARTPTFDAMPRSNAKITKPKLKLNRNTQISKTNTTLLSIEKMNVI